MQCFAYVRKKSDVCQANGRVYVKLKCQNLDFVNNYNYFNYGKQ